MNTNSQTSKPIATLKRDITDPDTGTIASAGDTVYILEHDFNGTLVETLDGRASFYADRDELELTRGFAATFGRQPVAGEDYDADGELSQDDYEWLTSTGAYAA